MPRMPGINRVLIIGSGPVIIGQSAEFDYAGSQAARSLREEGIYTILLNSNPATIQTDNEIADRIYIEPTTLEVVKEIIENERVDSLLCSMGGQTALNLLMEIEKSGIISKYNLNVLGTEPENIKIAEDRKEFHEKMISIGENIPRSSIIHSSRWMEEVETIQFYPFIARTSFSLGGKAGRIITGRDEAVPFFSEVFTGKDVSEVEIESSLLGLKELEYEVLRDKAGNAICICNMENLDPMGIHTGESIVVTPSLTLNDREYYGMREHALKIADSLNIIGACNVQFALDSENETFYVVEVNPRTSRSSALASKASGYPIARIATKLCIGYLLGELKNPITGNSSAAFEPSLDYVTVKIPKWPFEKFPGDINLGVSMKSTGEVMGIGRTFEEAMFKAVASLEEGQQFGISFDANSGDLLEYLKRPTHLRLRAIFQALKDGYNMETIATLTGWDREILDRLHSIITILNNSEFSVDNLRKLKELGIPDYFITQENSLTELDLYEKRRKLDLMPSFRVIDTSSNEFASQSGYFYSTYFENYDASPLSPGKSILIIGSGPNRISQGLEYDFGSVKTLLHLKHANIPTIMINSNPETVSTDYDVSGRLYFEPLKLEYIANIIKFERPGGIIIQFSGQTGQNMASDLARLFGKEIILGTSHENIDNIEDRIKFSSDLDRIGLPQTEFIYSDTLENLPEKIEQLGYPVILRSSFIIGGSSVKILKGKSELEHLMAHYKEIGIKGKILVNRYLENYDELDIDFISNGKDMRIAGISIHIEEAGIHSGDALSITGPDLIRKDILNRIEQILHKLTSYYELKGFSNLQLAVKDDIIMIIELNARLSRSFSFICKSTGINWIKYGIDAIIWGVLPDFQWNPKTYSAKIPVFPFRIFSGENMRIGPEMRSTGEMMVSGKTQEEMWSKIARHYGMDTYRHAVIYSDKNVSIRIKQLTAGINGIEVFNPDEIEEMIERIEFLNTPTFVDLGGEINLEVENIKKILLRRGCPVILNERLFMRLISSQQVTSKARELTSYHN